MAKQTESGASLRPSEMSAGGALIDDADVTIKSATFELYDFNGKAQSKACAALTLVTEEGEEHVEYLSAADPKHFMPSADNTRLLAVGDKTGLNNNSKFALFVISLINAGFPEADVTDSIDFLDGLRVHIKRKAAPKSWSSMKPRGGSNDREATILEVTEILDNKPAPKGKGGAAKTTAKAGGKKAAAADDLDAEVTTFVQQALEAAGGEITTKALVPSLYRLVTGDNKKAIVKRAYEAEFLQAGMEAGNWAFDEEAGTVTAL